MAQNATITTLDTGQVLRRVFSDANDCLRVDISSALGTSQTASATSASTGTILAAFSVVGMKTVALYSHTTTTIVGSQVCTLQVSPSDTVDIWVATSLTVTPSTTDEVIVLGAPISIAARRARVVIAAAITSGAFDIYAVAQSA